VTALVLVRHASAGDRERRSGDDRERPLDERGRRQAEKLVMSLAAYRFDRILSSPYLRCMQTMEPLAQRRGLRVEVCDELAEGASREEALGLVEKVRGAGVVLCTHGDVVLELLGATLRKGETAILEQ
jgi:phosphohistidine phosphatase SixA